MSNKKTDVDQQLIRDLAGILNDTNLSEIEVELGDLKIRVARQATVVQAHAFAPAAQPAFAAAPSAQPDTQAATAGDDLRNAVPSPMVGTAYLAPEPGARPFVEVGATVRQGQTLMIVEAMKTMNAIPAPKAGVVREVLVTDGQPVEFGEPLLIVD